MNKKIFNRENEYSYDYSLKYVDGAQHHSLYRSNAEFWCAPGEHVLTLIDDESFDFKLKPKLPKIINLTLMNELNLLYCLYCQVREELESSDLPPKYIVYNEDEGKIINICNSK